MALEPGERFYTLAWPCGCCFTASVVGGHVTLAMLARDATKAERRTGVAVTMAPVPAGQPPCPPLELWSGHPENPCKACPPPLLKKAKK